MYIIIVDFIMGLSSVSFQGILWSVMIHNSYNSLFMVINKSSKCMLLISGHVTYSVSDWGLVFGRHLLLGDWSCPKVIISNCDAKFIGDFWNGLWRSFGTRLMMTIMYHPQNDEQSERKNQIVELAIRNHMFDHSD